MRQYNAIGQENTLFASFLPVNILLCQNNALTLQTKTKGYCILLAEKQEKQRRKLE